MDVTDEILRNHRIYGGSDYTAAHSLAASRSLNYAKGASITKPDVENLSVIPFTFHYQDAVGLFGAENYFVRVNVKIDRRYTRQCFEEPYWECALITDNEQLNLLYEPAVIDEHADLTTVNDYEPAHINISPPLPEVANPYISVELKNLKTGNQFIDDWLDVRLYDKERMEVAGERMYVRLNDYFYLGVHARNTRRLPYNIELTVGEELRSGLPPTGCLDDWELATENCGTCQEETNWLCAEMHLIKGSDPDYVDAVVNLKLDLTTENSYQPARVAKQQGECLESILANLLNLPTGPLINTIPPPKTRGRNAHQHSRNCCAQCH